VLSALFLAGTALAGDLQVGGRVVSTLRLGLSDCAESDGCGLLDFGDTAVAGGWARARVGDRARASLALDLRLHHAVDAATVQETSAPGSVLGASARLQEARVELEQLFVPALDLRLGVQRVRWGTADGLHVADRVNPWDLENPMALDARLPVPMAHGLLHRGGLQLEGIWLPISWPAVLPRQGVQLAPEAQDLVGEGPDSGFGDSFQEADIQEVEARIEVPERNLGNTGGALRLSWVAPFGDVALSWFHGRDSLPQANGELVLTGFQTSSERVDVAVPLVYPRVDVLGLEARGELFAQLGGWVEAALVLPERTSVVASQTQLQALADLGTIEEVPDPLPETVTQDGQPYPNWILGLDRSFDRVYVNLQWLCGFPTERRWQDLRYYGLLATRITLADAAVLSLSAMADLGGQGLLARAELQLLHGDAAEFALGGAWVQAPEDSTLGAFRGVSQVYSGVELEF